MAPLLTLRAVAPLLVTAIWASGCKKPPPPLDDFGPLPEFELTDQKGREITHRDLEGHVSNLPLPAKQVQAHELGDLGQVVPSAR